MFGSKKLIISSYLLVGHFYWMSNRALSEPYGRLLPHASGPPASSPASLLSDAPRFCRCPPPRRDALGFHRSSTATGETLARPWRPPSSPDPSPQWPWRPRAPAHVSFPKYRLWSTINFKGTTRQNLIFDFHHQTLLEMRVNGLASTCWREFELRCLFLRKVAKSLLLY